LLPASQWFNKNIVPSIFVNLKDTRPEDFKIPLLYLEDDAVVNKWLSVNDKFVDGVLPDAAGRVGTGKSKRPHLKQNDFKWLYKMRAEDLDFLADEVLSKKVSVKSSTKKNNQPGVPDSLNHAADLEKRIRHVKNAMMLKYKNFALPSKAADYVPYPKEAWDTFAAEHKIGRSDLLMWVEATLASFQGSKWMDGRMKPNVRAVEETPEVLLSLWKQHIPEGTGVASASTDVSLFDSKYICRTLAARTNPVGSIWNAADVKEWLSEDYRQIYFWFLFRVKDNKSRATILDLAECQKIFDHLEKTSEANTLEVRAPAVVFTDAAGYIEILNHIKHRKNTSHSKKRIWSTHVLHYIPAATDGFPAPDIGVLTSVFCVFLYEYNSDQSPQESFKDLFGGRPEKLPAYLNAAEKSADLSRWSVPGEPRMRNSALDELFGGFLKPESVVVNVGGGAHFTYFGLVSPCLLPITCSYRLFYFFCLPVI
jgi:hypothetical protein